MSRPPEAACSEGSEAESGHSKKRPSSMGSLPERLVYWISFFLGGKDNARALLLGGFPRGWVYGYLKWSGFLLIWNKAELFRTDIKEGAELDTKVGAGLMASPFPALDRQYGCSQLVCQVLLAPIPPYPLLTYSLFPM